eukprot:jgi/Galph1/4798/GphlegSOOS_G3449.1
MIKASLLDLSESDLDAKLFQALKQREYTSLLFSPHLEHRRLPHMFHDGRLWESSSRLDFTSCSQELNSSSEVCPKVNWAEILKHLESSKCADTVPRSTSTEENCGKAFAKTDLERGICRLFIEQQSYPFLQKQAHLLWKLYGIRLDRSSCRVPRNNVSEKNQVSHSFEVVYNEFVLYIISNVYGPNVLKKACLLARLEIVNEVLVSILEEKELVRKKIQEISQQLTRCQAHYVFEPEKRISPVGGRRCMHREFSRIHVYARYISSGSSNRRGPGRYVVRGYLVEEAWMKDFCELLKKDFGIIVHISTGEEGGCGNYLNKKTNMFIENMGGLCVPNTESYFENSSDKLEMYLKSRYGLDWKAFFRQVLQRVQMRWLSNCKMMEKEQLFLLAVEQLKWTRLQKLIVDKYLYLENSSSLQQLVCYRVLQYFEYLLFSNKLPSDLEERIRAIQHRRNQLYSVSFPSAWQ